MIGFMWVDSFFVEWIYRIFDVVRWESKDFEMIFLCLLYFVMFCKYYCISMFDYLSFFRNNKWFCKDFVGCLISDYFLIVGGM